MRKLTLSSLLMTTMILGVVACKEPLVRGRDKEMEPLSKSFEATSTETFEAAKEALIELGYKIEYDNIDAGALRTAWEPTTADSHYLELFGKEDYGASASYYHLAVKISSEGYEKSVVTVSAPLRTIVAKMKTSHRVERKFLSNVEDRLRPADIQVTNVGVIQK